MNISYRWLEELAPGLTETPQEVADRLAMYGAPVDEMIALGDPITDIVIGRVESVERHPNADRLQLCEVDAGTGELLQVVCGAPNVHVGAYYPFAPVSAVLPGGIKIRKAKIRGVESQGMLCSEQELGLGREHGGIMELRGEFTPGENFVAALGLDDLRIVVDITPNRPDLLSHLGVARELAPEGVAGLMLPAFPGSAHPALAEVGFVRGETSADADGVSIRLEDTRGCTRYLGAVIRGVEVGPSPAWLASRLRAVGLRPINNVVDATNYILFELGQPLHAFDLARLEGRDVEIRRARAGERITTLDGVDRVLTEEMTVIADAARPVAVAGVMGGEESEVTAETRDIFLECALFDPGVTRRTRTALGLSTDASYRFERGVDPEGMEQAIRRALSLIVTVAGGEFPEEVVDLYPAPEAERVVGIRPGQTSRLLGIPFTAAEIVGELERIGFQPVAADAAATAATGGGGRAAGEKVTSPGGNTLCFRIPGYRWYDVEREADLIEEVARRYGYDNFPAELRASRPSAVPGDPMALLEDRLRTFMVGRGLMEARLGSFVPESDGDVGPLNPLSSAETRLRRSLVPGLLREVEANFAHTVRTVRLFEIGTVFAPAEEPAGPPREETRLALVITGAVRPVDWSGETPAVDLWDLKGMLTELRDVLGAGLAVEPGATAGTPIAASTALQIVSETGTVIGWGGKVEPAALDAPAWAGAVFAAEVTLHPDFAVAKRPRFVPLPAYPAIERDAALLVPDTTPAGEIESVIRAAGGELLEEVFVFDLFRGQGVPSGTRSIAYRLRFRARDRTLTDKEADRALDLVLKRLKEELGVERRG